MIRLDVVLMAHPRRKAYIAPLQASLDRPSRVVLDRRNDRWDTGRRSWQAIDKSATHGLVLQDDAVIPRDLVAGIETALQHVPDGSPLCLYCGRGRPYAELITQLVTKAGPGTSWLTMGQLHWGVGIVLPTKWIDDMIAWCDERTEIANYDRRISRWIQHMGLTVYYPWPSLVDHRDSPSLIPNRGSAGRRAHRFLGVDQSAADHDWSGNAASIPALSRNDSDFQSPWTGGPPVRFVSDKYPNLDLSNKAGLHGIRFVDGVCEVTRHNAISILQSKWWQRRGVRIATEGESARPEATPQLMPEPEPAPEPATPTPIEDTAAPEDDAPEGVPAGSAGDVLAWVGEDPERARQALDAEQQRTKPRASLAAKLEKLTTHDIHSASTSHASVAQVV